MGAIRTAGRLNVVLFLALAVVVTIAACGGDDGAGPAGGGGGTGGTAIASFVDCWVESLQYNCEGTPGFTVRGGTFDCALGDSVEFYVGDIMLGKGVAGPFLNPIEITDATDIFSYEPTNIACFLQTIDDDARPSNGILIIEAVRAAAVGKTINFDQRPADFPNDANVQQVISELTALTSAGTRTAVSYTDARNHLRSTMLAVLAGGYGGDVDGDRHGEWEMEIDTDGEVDILVTLDHPSQIISLDGNLQPGGSFTCSDGGGVGLTFFGKIQRDTNGRHEVEGSWDGYELGGGTFDGSRDGYPSTITCR